MAMVASASVRRTRRGRRGRKEEKEEGGRRRGVENCGGWVGTGKKGRLRGEEGRLARKRPPRKWRHKRPHGREAPSLDAGDGPGDGEKGKIGEKRPARGKGARGGYTAGM